MSGADELTGVLGVVDATHAAALLESGELPEGADGLEIRADLLESIDQAFELLERFRSRAPLLFTLRIPDEGGKYEGADADRIPIFLRAIECGASAVDIEFGTEAASELAEDIPVVLSHHNFDGPFTDSELAALTVEMSAFYPSVIKIVPTAERLEHSVQMLRWVEEQPADGPKRVGFAMGEKGLPSRVLSMSRGAQYTYASLGDAVAPGQLSAAEMSLLYGVDRLGASTITLGVIGNPVAHSLSPHMHNPALRAAGVDAVYLPIRLDDIAELDGCWDALRLKGLSVTIPFKADAYRLADTPDDRSKNAGASNTLVCNDDGSLASYNTDYDGVLGPLVRTIGELKGQRIAVLGNGGAARGAIEALKEASAVPSLVYRNPDRGRPVAEELAIASCSFAEFDSSSVDVIINATSLGLKAGDASPLADGTIASNHVAFDMIYSPPNTEFLRQARDVDAKTIPGGDMLVAQGLVQFRLFTGAEPDAELFAKSFAEALAKRAD